MTAETHSIPFEGGRLYAHFDKGRLRDLLWESLDGARDIGAIYMARVDRPVKGLGGVFVDLGHEKSFLRCKNPPRQGSYIPVQIQQFANADKPLRVSEQLDFRGEFAVLTPDRPGIHQSRSIKSVELLDEVKEKFAAMLPENCGMILRSAARFADFAMIERDVELLRERLDSVQKAPDKTHLVAPVPTGDLRAFLEWGESDYEEHEYFPDYLLEMIHNELAQPLMCAGGEVYIEPTRALIAVDVNTGANTAPTAARDVNVSVANKLPLWLRLMGWGGQIVIDAAPMPLNARKTFEATFAKAAKTAGLNFVGRGFGPLAMYEGAIRYDRRPLPKNILGILEN